MAQHQGGHKAIHERRMKELPPPLPIEPVVAAAKAHVAAGVPIIAATTLKETSRYLQLAWGVDSILLEQADFVNFDGA